MSDDSTPPGGGVRRVTYGTTDGITLVGDAWGDPSHPPVLLLHGGGQTRHAWGDTAQALAERGWYVVALDLRGHGESDWAPNGRYAFEDFASDLGGVVRNLSRPPAVVGASLGGMVALLAQGQAIEPLFSAVVLVDIAPDVEPEGIRRVVGFMLAHPEGFSSIEEAADAISGYLPHRDRPEDLGGLERTLRRGDDGRYRWRWDVRLLTERDDLALVAAGDIDELATQMRNRLTEAARRLEVPTLLVRGALSDVVSERGTRDFLGLVPHARHVDVPGAGHMVAGDRNDAFTAAVVDFLTEVRG